jgi:hypothetical protein
MGRLWLHCLSMTLKHPATGEVLCLQSPLGCHALSSSLNADWQQLLQMQAWQFDEPSGLAGLDH